VEQVRNELHTHTDPVGDHVVAEIAERQHVILGGLRGVDIRGGPQRLCFTGRLAQQQRGPVGADPSPRILPPPTWTRLPP
jgi:hypothetical protein